MDAHEDDLDIMHRTIDAIYRATLDRAHWGAAMEAINGLLGASGTCYIRSVFEGTGAVLPETRDFGLTGRNGSDFRTYEAFSHIDPCLPHLRLQRPTDILTEYDFMDDTEIDRHPFYTEFMLPHGVRYRLATAIPGGERDWIGLIAMRSPEQGPPGARELRLAKMLACHLARSSEIERRLDGHASMQQLLADSLDAVPDGLFVVKGDARLVHANRAGNAMLELREPVTLNQGRLVAIGQADRKLFEAMIANASQTVDRHKAVPLGLALSAADGTRCGHATAMPISADEGAFALMEDVARDAVLVIVSGRGAKTATADRLAMLYDFTPAEARLAAALAEGMDLASYAQAQCLSTHTVRWTLKRLLFKTECSRQSDLVRQFSSAAATWGAAG